MTFITDVTLSSSTSINEASVNYNTISSVLTLLGWRDQNRDITAAHFEERILGETLQANYKRHVASPDLASMDHLNTSLTAVISKLTQNRDTATRLAQEATNRMNQQATEQSQSNQGVGFFEDMTARIKTFFGSDDEALKARYEGLALQYNSHLQELSNLRYNLQASIAELETTRPHPSHQRRLLQTVNFTFPITNEQFCYSMLGCDFGDLSDGRSGFSLGGKNINGYADALGFSVSPAGDVNGDGIADIIVGAPGGERKAGSSYVVFGSRNSTVWGNGILDIRNLMNGQQGFVLQGEASNDASGTSVSAAGDINGDGISDIIVGTYIFNQPGKSYVVFGSRNNTAWGNGSLSVSSLMNGQRGFVLQGDAVNDFSGSSVSTAGDVNGDAISDIIIGAMQASKGYVVFGSNLSTAWGNGILTLANLMNGQRGFVLQGDPGDRVGASVSAAGDVNGDGVSDILVGAPNALSWTGKSYVVFGSKNSSVWGSGILNLSSLTDGLRGFSLHGGYGSSVVSTLGDINGDKASDIIVSMSKTYVVFGTENRSAWSNGVLSLDNLMNSQRGFILGNTYGASVSTAGDINDDGTPDILVGASTTNAGGVSYVVFGKPVLSTSLYFTANYLRINGAQNISITPQNLAVSSGQPSFTENITRFTVQNLSHGAFTTLAAPGTPLFVFYMQNVSDGQIQFRHDGTLSAPQYRISAVNSQAQNSPLISIYSDAQIDFLGHSPKLVANTIFVNQYETTLVQSKNLEATDPDNTNSELFFTIHSLTHGQFMVHNTTTNLTTPTSRFSQQAILDGRVIFVQDGSRNAPSYTVTVSDFRSTTVGQAANITFRYAPLVTFKPAGLVIDQGRVTTLTWQDIDAKGTESFPGSLTIEVENVTHGHFAYSNNPNQAINVFQRLFLITSTLQFVQDGSAMTPNFALRAFDGLYTPWQVPLIQLNHRPLAHGSPDAQSILQDEDYSFTLPSNIFSDPDVNDTLTYRAQLAGGAPLPVGIEFDAFQRQFSGKLSTISSFIIEVQAIDRRGLTASTRFVLSSIESTAAYYRNVYSSISGLAGIGVSVLAYLWLRRRIAKHRRNFPLANTLRKVLNLEYFDFTRFDGDAFKTKVNDFLQRMQLDHPDFYNGLTPEEQKSFAVCVAEILTVRGLVFRSDYGGGLFGIFCCLNVGWPSQLDIKAFEIQSVAIIEEAVATWKQETGYKLHPMSDLSNKEKGTIYVEIEDNSINYTVIDRGVRQGGEKGSITAQQLGLEVLPTNIEGLTPYFPKILEVASKRGHIKSNKGLKKWPYHSPSRKEKARVFFCCAKPSTAGMFSASARQPSVELENLKKREGVNVSFDKFVAEEKSADLQETIGILKEQVEVLTAKVEALEESKPLLNQGR